MTEVSNQAGALDYSAVYSAAIELGYSELQAMAYATEPDLFVADNPDWIFEDSERDHDIATGSQSSEVPDGR